MRCCGLRRASNSSPNTRWRARLSTQPRSAKNIALADTTEFRERRRKGCCGQSLTDAMLLVGSPRLLREAGRGISARPMETRSTHWEESGRARWSVVAETAGWSALSRLPTRSRRTPRRPSNACRRSGIRTVMITGDNRRMPARTIARRARNRPCVRRGAAAGKGRSRFASCRARARASPLSATASTMRRRSRRPISASPWAPEPISPSRPATSCW